MRRREPTTCLGQVEAPLRQHRRRPSVQLRIPGEDVGGALRDPRRARRSCLDARGNREGQGILFRGHGHQAAADSSKRFDLVHRLHQLTDPCERQAHRLLRLLRGPCEWRQGRSREVGAEHRQHLVQFRLRQLELPPHADRARARLDHIHERSPACQVLFRWRRRRGILELGGREKRQGVDSALCQLRRQALQWPLESCNVLFEGQ
mmetsp:Transcript_15032/g.43412  ORF Transcript_15032/g.43412 Transcript_15032/m.43412 type:complete len:206 (-) Transcript_15032:1117-1734(-)